MNVNPDFKYSIGSVLFLAFELSDKKWDLVFCDGKKYRHVTIEYCQTEKVTFAISEAKTKFGLAPDCQVLSCYEAGWEGFWLHRWLATQGIDNLILESSSIEVNRKAKRVKTDKVDGK